MERFDIIIRDDQKSHAYADNIRYKLTKSGWFYDPTHPTTVIVVGGDGSMLHGISRYIDHVDTIQFVGIKTGTLGFLCDYKDDEVDRLVHDLTTHSLVVHDYPLLSVKTDCHHHIFYAVNECRVENIVVSLDMQIHINDEFFEDYRGTGMCVTTQLGSTAYNRSIGGAVIQEGLDAIEMTPIAGIHHMAYRSFQSPLILSGNSIIKMESTSFENARLGIDALSYPLDGCTMVETTLSSRKVHIVRGKIMSYLNRLSQLF